MDVLGCSYTESTVIFTTNSQADVVLQVIIKLYT